MYAPLQMIQRNSQIDVTEIDFEPKYLSHSASKQIEESQASNSSTNRLSTLQNMYQNLLNNTKQIISKLCFMLGKFLPFDSAINQAFSFIEKLQREWQYFKAQNYENSIISGRSQLSKRVESKRQHQPIVQKLKESQIIEIPPIVKLHNLMNSQVSSKKIYPFLSRAKQDKECQDQKESLSISCINVDQQMQAKSVKSTKSVNTQEYRMNLKDQFYHIRQFVIFWLYPKLEVHENKTLQKRTVLNCYIAWNRRVRRQILITQTSKLQTELTVQIKLKIPSAESKFRVFGGIGFKEEFINQINLTDCKPVVVKPLQEIAYSKDCSLHPIDEIIMVARRLQKNDVIEPYGEQKMQALDEALGLI